MSMPSMPPLPGAGAGIDPSAIAGGVGKLAQFRETLRKIGHWLWVPNWTLPAQGAVLTAAVLIVSELVVWAILRRDTTSVPWRYGMTFRSMLELNLLTLVIPFFVYVGLRVLMDSDRALFPDLDYAWTAGLDALRANGLSLDNTPIYLVLGATGEDLEIDLFRSTGKGFRVRGIPEGPAALHWYAHTDAIYLCCTEVGVLSALAHLSRKNAQDVLSGRGPADGSIDANLTGLSNQALNVLSLQQTSAQSARLRTLCRLLRMARDPASPVNGIITLLPYEMSRVSPREIQQLAEAVELDLHVIRTTLQVRSPVTAVVTGVDQHPGFRELMRRVGMERTQTQRFGQAFDLRGDSTCDALRQFSDSACAAFDEWAGVLFREADVLSRPGNLPLFALLCEVRSKLKAPLGQVLSRGFGYVPGQHPHERRNLFNGCYFVAASRSPDRQAFVRGVIDQVEAQQDAVEWMPSALRRDRHIRKGLWVAMALNVGLLGALLYQVATTRFP